MDNLNLFIRQFRPTFWKVVFAVNGLKYHPIGGGEGEEVTLETQATEIAALKVELGTAKEAGGKGFYGGLSTEVQNNPSMLKFKDKSSEDVAKSYIELQGKIGAKGVIVPIDGASDDEISNFHKAIGRPDNADGYQIEVPKDLHESIVSTAESQKVFKTQCHKMGLNTKQAQNLHSWYMTELSNVLKRQDVDDKKASDEADTTLHSKWGTTYDVKLALASKVISKFGGEKAHEFLDKGFGNNPAIVEMMANIGEKFSEDVLGPGGKSGLGGMSPQVAQDRVAAIRADSKHAYHNAGPGHTEAVAEMLELNKIITAGKSQSDM